MSDSNFATHLFEHGHTAEQAGFFGTRCRPACIARWCRGPSGKELRSKSSEKTMPKQHRAPLIVGIAGTVGFTVVAKPRCQFIPPDYRFLLRSD